MPNLLALTLILVDVHFRFDIFTILYLALCSLTEIILRTLGAVTRHLSGWLVLLLVLLTSFFAYVGLP